MESNDAAKGILTITVVEGKLIRDTEIFGKMSPYCTLSYNGKKLKTRCHDYGGKTPRWGDSFALDIVDATKDL